MSASRNPKP